MRLHQFIVDKAPQLFKAEKQLKDDSISASSSIDEGNSLVYFIFL